MLNLLNKTEIISDILDRADIFNVNVIDVKLHDGKCVVIKQDDGFYIGVDMEQIHSVAELRCVIWHELGHIATNSFYGDGVCNYDKSKAERAAIRWAVMHCVPFDELCAAIKNGVKNVYDLAEYFTITIDSAQKVLDYYRGRIIDYLNLFYGEQAV